MTPSSYIIWLTSDAISGGESLIAHTAAVKKALFCHDDRRIVSAADDKSVR